MIRRRFHSLLLDERIIIAGSHAAFASICLIRPNLDTIFRAYQPFVNVTAWGVGLGSLAVVLLLAHRASLLLMLAQLVSAMAMFTIAGLLTLGVGLLPTAAVTAWLGFISIVLFTRSFGEWLDTQDWYWRRRATPPRWLEKKAWFRRLRDRVELHG
ncbi:hypothetical protein [Deinococcus sp. UYEF24]